jgi:hypothetical protein
MSTGVALVTSDWNSSGDLVFKKASDGSSILTIAAAGTVTAAAGSTSTGAFTPSAGIVPVSVAKHFYAGGVAPAATTSGTDTAGINGTLFISEVFIPCNATLTGISFLLGSVGGTDKVVVALFDSTGAIVANSALDASVTAGTTATFQRVPFTATYAAKGPAKYYIGVQTNGNTAKIRTQAFGDHETVSISQTFDTLVAISPPTTFTASVGPIAMTY